MIVGSKRRDDGDRRERRKHWQTICNIVTLTTTYIHHGAGLTRNLIPGNFVRFRWCLLRKSPLALYMYTFSETLQSFNELYSVASQPLNRPPSPRLAQDISFYPTTTYGPSMIPHYATFGIADMGSDPNFPEFADLAEFAQSRPPSAYSGSPMHLDVSSHRYASSTSKSILVCYSRRGRTVWHIYI